MANGLQKDKSSNLSLCFPFAICLLSVCNPLRSHPSAIRSWCSPQVIIKTTLLAIPAVGAGFSPSCSRDCRPKRATTLSTAIALSQTNFFLLPAKYQLS